MISIVQAVLALFAEHGPVRFPHEEEGQVTEVIEPGRVWQISHGASYWFARSYRRLNLNPGDLVRVIDRHGIVLIIEPLEVEE